MTPLVAMIETEPQAMPAGAGRTAELLMRPERLGAFWAGPLSFSRSLFRIIERERWEVTRESFALDASGEGEALYRVRTPGMNLFFFVLSFAVAPEEKTDRVIGVKWDAMASLFVGEPSRERLDEMRREMPRQKTGRADADTLIWLRGNKSLRSFEAVVAGLAAGRQPDPVLLQGTGYLFRTTAFYGNGKLGTMSFAALRRLDALSEPYHAQIMSAWLLREFICDLVDDLAGSRSPHAARLDTDHRRYVGIGNSAGVGIVPFITRHPKIIHAWLGIYEDAIEALRTRSLDPETTAIVQELTARAVRYFDGLPASGGPFFLSPADLATELRTAGTEIRARAVDGRRFDVAAFLDWAGSELSAETQELLHAILMETDPDLVEALQPRFTVDEAEPLRPAERLSTLAEGVRSLYGWTGDTIGATGERHYFWYRSHEAGEPRISERNGLDWSRRELQMDVPVQIAALAGMAADHPDMNVAELLLARPDLYTAVRRVQAGLPRAEVRANLIARDVVAMPLIRFILALYGMERFAPGSDRWVRGTLLQGAPTAGDLAAGRPGTWPFPLPPTNAGAAALQSPERPVRGDEGGDGKRLEEVIRGHHYTLLPLAPGDGATRVSTPELIVLAESALRSLGVPAGLAQEAGEFAVLAEMLTGTGISAVAEALAATEPGGAAIGPIQSVGPGSFTLAIAGRSLAVIGPVLVEAIIALAAGAEGPVELSLTGATGLGVLPAVLVKLAARELTVSAIGSDGGLLASAGPTGAGPSLTCSLPLLGDGITFKIGQPLGDAGRSWSAADLASAVELAERRGLALSSTGLEPVVQAADRILLEADATGSVGWGKGG